MILLATALAGGGMARAADGLPYTVVELGRGYARLQDAVNAIGDRMATIRIAPGTHRDCAIQRAGDIAFVAASPQSTVLAGRTCEDKAALVLRGRSARVEGLTFAGLTSRDGNGAGIRLEHGNLLIRRSWFRDSQQGLLTASDPAGRVTIERSTFTRLGTCTSPAGCAHSVYVGDYGELVITGSRFEAGAGGHYVKCRAPRITVRDSSFDDTAGTGTNYMIDLPQWRKRADRRQLVRARPEQGKPFRLHRRCRRGTDRQFGRAGDRRQPRQPGAGPDPDQRLRRRLVGRPAVAGGQCAGDGDRGLRSALGGRSRARLALLPQPRAS